MKNVYEDCVEFYDRANNGVVFKINDDCGVIIKSHFHGYREFATDENGNNIISLDDYNTFVGELTKRERKFIMNSYEFHEDKAFGSKLIPVFIYLYPFAVTVGAEYLEENYEGGDYVYFPRQIVIDYYYENEADFQEETAMELGKPINECTFDDWFNDVCTADSVEGLFEFALWCGFTPHLPATC